MRFTVGGSRWRSVVVLAATGTLTLLLGACGRSAPEDLAAPAGDVQAADSGIAGIQVISENPVVATSPTSPPAVTTATTAAAPAAAATTHLVEPGDTLSVLAEKYGVTIEAISQANGIENVNDIKPGQELIIPAQAG